MSLDALHAGLGDDWPFETFPQYLDALEKRGSAINVAALFGHTPLRMYVMGEESTERAATADEIGAMKKLMREAMEAGAIGFGTSVSISHNGYAGKPVPSRQATVEEMDALVSVMGDMKRGLMQITIGREFSTRHMAEVSRKYGVPVTWTALLSYLYGPGGHRKQLDLAAEQRKSGALVIPQVSCRPLNFEFTFAEPFIFDVMKFMNELAVEDAKAPGTRRRAYADPAWREKLRSEVTPLFQRWWDRVVIAWAPSARELEEQPLADGRRQARQGSGRSRPRPRARQRPAGALPHGRDELRREGSGGADHRSQHHHRVVRRRRPCQPALRRLLLDLPAGPLGARASKTFTIEQAVHNLTQRPAEMFGITDRGLLAEGRPADVVVFDPKTVGPGPLKRVYDLPAGADRLVSEASGIDAVIVNGKLIRRDGKDAVAANDKLPGRLLRHGRAA